MDDKDIKKILEELDDLQKELERYIEKAEFNERLVNLFGKIIERQEKEIEYLNKKLRGTQH